MGEPGGGGSRAVGNLSCDGASAKDSPVRAIRTESVAQRISAMRASRVIGEAACFLPDSGSQVCVTEVFEHGRFPL